MMMREHRRKPCTYCGTWVCQDCGRVKSYAPRTVTFHDCRRCRSPHGHMEPLVHRSLGMALDHDEEATLHEIRLPVKEKA